MSLSLAIEEQGLSELQQRLQLIVPDLRQQYSSFEILTPYQSLKVRGQHAFQVALAGEAIKSLKASPQPLTIVDIGDSAGSHIQYLKGIHNDKEMQCISVNCDEAAINRIKSKDLRAERIRAEDLPRHGIKAEIFLSFEMLEHLENPIQFLRRLSYESDCQALVITVPYLRKSRTGFHQIRGGKPHSYNPENTHIFEFSPEDWRLLFMHAGWSVRQERVYFQYPRHGVFRLMKPLWKKLDFEGFWGAILQRDHVWSDHYVDDKS